MVLSYLLTIVSPVPVNQDVLHWEFVLESWCTAKPHFQRTFNQRLVFCGKTYGDEYIAGFREACARRPELKWKMGI
jgi:hypothetical protein